MTKEETRELIVMHKQIISLLEQNIVNEQCLKDLPMKEEYTTLTLKMASEYCGLTQYRLRQLALQKKIPHLKAGNRFIFRTNAIDKWLNDEEQSNCVQIEEEKYGTLRKIKE